MAVDDDKHTLRTWFGLSEPFDWRKRSYLGPLLFVVGVLVVGGLFTLAIAAAFKLLGSAVFGGLPQGAGSSFGLTGIIVAMIGAPFVVWRAVVAQKQVNVAEQGMITDRISKAVEGLGAEKTVKKDGEESTTPNLEVRIGAIYALERIAQDSDRDHIQIMEILCAYIRENAPANEKNEEIERTEAEISKTFASVSKWVEKQPKPRTDISIALQVLGRRSERQILIEQHAKTRRSSIGYQLDLQNTCLRHADLSNLNFSRAMFHGANLQGANLIKTQLRQSEFVSSNLILANFGQAELMKSNLQFATMNHAKLINANLEKANLYGVKMFQTGLRSANLTEALLSSAELIDLVLQNVNFDKCNFEHAQLQHCSSIQCTFNRAQMKRASILSCTFYETDFSKAHFQETQVEDSKFNSSQFEVSFFDETNIVNSLFDDVAFGNSTFLLFSSFVGTAVRHTDLTGCPPKVNKLTSLYADATVTLPDGVGPETELWPEHWSRENLDWDDFQTQWRAFQASIGQDPDNPA